MRAQSAQVVYAVAFFVAILVSCLFSLAAISRATAVPISSASTRWRFAVLTSESSPPLPFRWHAESSSDLLATSGKGRSVERLAPGRRQAVPVLLLGGVCPPRLRTCFCPVVAQQGHSGICFCSVVSFASHLLLFLWLFCVRDTSAARVRF